MPAGSGPREWPESGQVELGLRPEAIGIHQASDSPRSPSSPVFEAQVRRLEFNGPDVLATLSLGPHRVIARLPAGRPIQERQRLHILVDMSQAAWFEPTSGQSLLSGPLNDSLA